MHILFINRFFHPDHSATSQMLSDLAFALAEQGHHVSVLTSRQRYEAPEERLPRHETIRRVEVYRLRTSRFGRYNLLGRAVDYLTFYVSAAWALWRLARAGAVIVAKTDPPMLSLLAGPIATLRGATLVNWLQDLFPEVAQALGMGRGRISRYLYRLLRFLRDRSLQRAALNVVLGERMAEKLASLGIARQRICILPNWADGALIEPVDPAANTLRAEWGLTSAFVIGYAGNLGRAYEYGTLLEAIEWLEAKRGTKASPKIIWLFIGGGALYGALQDQVRRRGLTSVRFRSYQPRERLAESLSAADVHLVLLRPELEGLIVPSKFYGITAAGRPALFIGDPDGEIARLIARHGCGLTVAQGDGVGLAQIILNLATDPERCQRLGKCGRAAFEAEFDKSIAVAYWEKLLGEVYAPATPVAQDARLKPAASARKAR